VVTVVKPERFCEGFSKQLVEIIKKKLPRRLYRFSTAVAVSTALFRRALFGFAFWVAKRRRPRLPPGAKDPCHHRLEQINDNRSKQKPNTGALSELTKSDVTQLLQTGLADFSLRETFGLLNHRRHRRAQRLLEKEPTDKPNGFYDRSFSWEPFLSKFACPALEPESSGRRLCLRTNVAVTAKEVQSLLLGLLGSSRSINAERRPSEDGPVQLRNRIWNVWRLE